MDAGDFPTSHPKIQIRLFGPLRVIWRPETVHGDDGRCVDITADMQPRSRELLALLAVEPTGPRRDRILTALWPVKPPAQPTNAINTAVSRLRASVAAATRGEVAHVVSGDRVRYRLDSSAVAVDLWAFIQAVRNRRSAGTDAARADVYRRIIDLAGNEGLATDVDGEWLEPIREAVRRDTTNAATALSALLIDHDPRQALEIHETVLDLDPHNEIRYRDMIRLHAELGEFQAIDHTLALLTRRLAEIHEKPTRETLDLVKYLRKSAA